LKIEEKNSGQKIEKKKKLGVPHATLLEEARHSRLRPGTREPPLPFFKILVDFFVEFSTFDDLNCLRGTNNCIYDRLSPA